MGVSGTWLNDQPETEIVYIILEGNWTWDDFFQFVDQHLDPMLLTIDKRKGCVICDMTKSPRLPMDAITQATRLIRRGTHWDLTVVVGSNAFAKMPVNVITRLLPNLAKNVATAETLEQAITLIETHRAQD